MPHRNSKPDLTLVPKEMNPMDPFGVMPQFQKMMEMFQVPGANPFNLVQPPAPPAKAPAAETAKPPSDPLGLEKMLNPLGLPVPDAVKMLLPVVSNPVNQFNFLTSNAQAAWLQMIMLQQSSIASMMAMAKLMTMPFPPQYR